MGIVEQAARDNHLARVCRLVLEIGQWSGVELAALEFALCALTRGTVLEGAALEYHTPPLLLYCQACENEYLGDQEDLSCPACQGTDFQVLRGRELIVKSVAGEAREP